MMILRSAPASPFARKVRIGASLLGLTPKIELQAADPNDAADTLRKQNPLGKIPVLVLEDGTALYDSRVILEYLDHLAGGGRIVPREPSARFAALRLQALCDGICDACLLIIYEGRYRPADKRVQSLGGPAGGKSRARASRARGRAAEARSRCPTSARSRSPARSAIATCASTAHGARSIPGCSPGTTSSLRKCRRSKQRNLLPDP